MKEQDFSHVATSADGSQQSVGITACGKVFTWGKSNEMGQLGRTTMSRKDCRIPTPAALPSHAARGFAGGNNESGHTVVLDSDGYLWMAGCDRWQQLGLGSAEGGAAGYTWENGRIWRESFVRNDFINDLLVNRKESVRDVALGGDHTLVLSSNMRDVYASGKGGDGQLGLVGKPFVSAWVRSSELSSSKAEIAAVCAIQQCSLTLDGAGHVLKKAGRCKLRGKEDLIALRKCIERATKDGLLIRGSTSN